jgi:hypothetical protein
MLFAALIGGQPACSLLRDACAESAAQRATVASLVGEAQLALDQAEVIVSAIPTLHARLDAFRALDAAKAALRAGAASLAGANEICESIDFRAAFAEFASAWRALETYLQLFGGEGESAVLAPMLAGAQ